MLKVKSWALAVKRHYSISVWLIFVPFNIQVFKNLQDGLGSNAWIINRLVHLKKHLHICYALKHVIL